LSEVGVAFSNDQARIENRPNDRGARDFLPRSPAHDHRKLIETLDHTHWQTRNLPEQRFLSTTRQEPKEATAKAPRRQEIQELGVLAPWRFP
jgi:hypothetical protein